MEEIFSDTVLIDNAVKRQNKENFCTSSFAQPCKFRRNYNCRRNFNKAEQVAVLILLFIKLFHKLLINLLIPNALYDDHKIRLYGFHGTSHKRFRKAIDYLEKVQNNQYPFGQWLYYGNS
jgi:acetate kinase